MPKMAAANITSRAMEMILRGAAIASFAMRNSNLAYLPGAFG
jgi:hypothetical protein